MGTKEQLLTLLENNKGTFFSGEDIAGALHVSRTAVWKAVRSLRMKVTVSLLFNRGYSLSADTDILSAQGIRKYLAPVCRDLNIKVLPAVHSTNDLIREKATAGAPEGCTLIALHQTAGKGRRGHSFYSPAGTGILHEHTSPAETLQCAGRGRTDHHGSGCRMRSHRKYIRGKQQ